MAVEQETVTDVDPDGYATRRLRADIRDSAKLLTYEEVRALVDMYYDYQKLRIQSGNRARMVAMQRDTAGASVASYFLGMGESIESQLRSAMDAWGKAQEAKSPDGAVAFSRATRGIGPVMSAGFAAYLLADDPLPATVGHWWSFAGLEPNVKWGKGEKRPYSVGLKTLCWKLGGAFVMGRGMGNDLYRSRKQYELERDEQGGNAEAAATTLKARNIQDAALRKTYESGHLPAGRLDLRARRWAVKLWISAYHEIALAERGMEQVKPYAIGVLGHAHAIKPSDWLDSE